MIFPIIFKKEETVKTETFLLSLIIDLCLIHQQVKPKGERKKIELLLPSKHQV